MLSWDDDLAGLAQRDAATCIFAHTGGDPGYDVVNARYYPGSLGQGITMTGNCFPSIHIRNYFQENIYVYDNIFNRSNSLGGHEIGHFSQLVCDQTKAIGCGMCNICAPKPLTCINFCNYAYQGLGTGLPIYVAGTPCSQCEAGWNWCADGLCATAKMCAQKGRVCTCELICENGGVLDKKACACTCPAAFQSYVCDKPCTDGEDWCSYQSTTNITQDGPFCKKKFGLCLAPPMTLNFPNAMSVYSVLDNLLPVP